MTDLRYVERRRLGGQGRTFVGGQAPLGQAPLGWASLVGDAWMDRRRRRKSAEFNCSPRVIAGSQVGLGDGWRDGHVSVPPGRTGM